MYSDDSLDQLKNPNSPDIHDHVLSLSWFLYNNNKPFFDRILEGKEYVINGDNASARIHYENIIKLSSQEVMPACDQAVITIICLSKIAKCCMNFTDNDIKSHWKIVDQLKLAKYVEKFGKERYVIAMNCYCTALALFDKHCADIILNPVYELLECKDEAIKNLRTRFFKRISQVICENEAKLLDDQVCEKQVDLVEKLIIEYRHDLKNCRDVIKKEVAVLYDGQSLRSLSEYASKNFGLELSQKITDSLKRLLSRIINDSIERLNRNLGNFVVYGIGSMSREEMCPYSDIEYGILIEHENQRADFRMLARTISLVIISLGETEFEVLQAEGNVREFKKRNLRPYMYLVKRSVTPIGFSTDTAGLQPLGYNGEFELINTPQELFALVNNRSLLEKYPHLINALKTLCPIIYNAPNLLENYDDLLKSQNSGVARQLALQLIEPLIEKYQPNPSAYQEEERYFDVKKQIYRLPNMSIEGLAAFYQLKDKGSAKRLKSLVEKGYLNQKNAELILKLLNIAMLLRICAQLFYNEETDFIHHTILESRYQLTEAEKSQIYFVSPAIIDDILYCYRILFPLHRSLKHFYQESGVDKTSFITGIFLDDDLASQGAFLQKMCKYEESIDLLKRSIAIVPDNIVAQRCLAECLSDAGNYTAALERWNKIQQHHVLSDDIDSQLMLHVGLGSVYLEIAKSGIPLEGDPFKLSEKSLKQAKTIIEESKHRMHNLQYVDIIIKLGVISSDRLSSIKIAKKCLSNIVEREKYYYLAILEKESALHQLQLVQALRHVFGTNTELLMQWRKEARDHLFSSIDCLINYYSLSGREEIVEKYYTPLLLDCYRYIANTSRNLDDFETAEEYFKKSLLVVEYLYSNLNHPLKLKLYEQFYKFIFTQRKYKEGLELAEKTLQIAIEIFGNVDESIALIRKDIANCCLCFVRETVDARKYCLAYLETSISLKNAALCSDAYALLGEIDILESKFSDALKMFTLQYQYRFLLIGAHFDLSALSSKYQLLAQQSFIDDVSFIKLDQTCELLIDDCDDISIAEALSNVSKIHFLLERYKDACKYYYITFKVQGNFRATLPPLSAGHHQVEFDMPCTAIQLADSLQKSNNDKMAIQYYCMAIDQLKHFNLSGDAGYLFIYANRCIRTLTILYLDQEDSIAQCRMAIKNTTEFIEKFVSVKSLDRLKDVMNWLAEDYLILVRTLKKYGQYDEATEICEQMKSNPSFVNMEDITLQVDQELMSIKKQRGGWCSLM